LPTSSEIITDPLILDGFLEGCEWISDKKKKKGCWH